MSSVNFKKILIAVDASEHAVNAAKVGLALAKQLNAATALLFVVDTSKSIGNIEIGITQNDALIVLKKEAEQTLDQLATMFNGYNPIKLMPEGHPKEEIYKTAEVWEADLIVIGTHGKTGLAHLLSENKTEYIVRHTSIPVMIVPCK